VSDVIEQFIRAVNDTAKKVREEYQHSPCLVFHHNDADGIASGAILSAAFARLNMRVARYCLEKPFPEVVRRILEERDERLIVVADFGSGVISQFVRLLPPDGKLLLLDHHQLEEGWGRGHAPQSSRVFLLNPITLGINGSRGACAASVCALFAESLSPDNRDLTWLGVLGWLGDGHRDEGLNRVVSARALEGGSLSRDARGVFMKGDYSLTSIVDGVNALGAFDYQRGGPDFALKGLLSGEIRGMLHLAEKARGRYAEGVWGEDGIILQHHLTAPIQWFSLGDSCSDFGVKTVGLVCEDLIAQGRVDPDRYLVGFQRVPNAIPGIGPVPLNQVKVSMRLPTGIAAQVSGGAAAPLTELLPLVARSMGGLVDGCHPHAAAVSIDVGREEELIGLLAELLASPLVKRG
jgi:hypothetical protein